MCPRRVMMKAWWCVTHREAFPKWNPWSKCLISRDHVEKGFAVKKGRKCRHMSIMVEPRKAPESASLWLFWECCFDTWLFWECHTWQGGLWWIISSYRIHWFGWTVICNRFCINRLGCFPLDFKGLTIGLFISRRAPQPSEVSCSLKKEWNSNTCHNVDKPWGYYAKWHKPVAKKASTVLFHSHEVLRVANS